MSSVPPNIVGPIMQAVVQQQQASQADDANQARRSAQSRQMAQRSEQAQNAVEDTDDDTTVHSEAGQGGGQGRAFSETPEEAGDESDGKSSDQVTRDDDGQVHIDVQA